MNAAFGSIVELKIIKVDREGRPDVDRVYMSAVQAMAGGGWPMSVFLNPNLKPFYGATYVPLDQFRKLIDKIHEIWTIAPEGIRRPSWQITEFLEQQILAEGDGAPSGNSIFTKGLDQFRQIYDRQYAGIGKEPKFPRPTTFNYLLRYYHCFGEKEAL